MDMTIRAMTPDEKKYSYTTDAETLRATGCIGHLRGDMEKIREKHNVLWKVMHEILTRLAALVVLQEPLRGCG